MVNNLTSSEATSIPSLFTSSSTSLAKNPSQPAPRMDDVVSSESTPPPSLSSDETPPQSPTLASKPSATTTQQKPVSTDIPSRTAAANDTTVPVASSNKAMINDTAPGVTKLADSVPTKQTAQSSKDNVKINISSDVTKIGPKINRTTAENKIEILHEYEFDKSDLFEQFVAIIHEENLGMVRP